MSLFDQKLFFKDLYVSIEHSCSAEQLKNFANLDSDEARFKFVHGLNGVRAFDELKCSADQSKMKNPIVALELKKRGNLAFQAQNWPVALNFYNKSQLVIPAENGIYFY